MEKSNLNKLLMLAIASSFAIGCTNDDVAEEEVFGTIPDPEPIQELTVSDNFDWSTTKDVALNIGVNFTNEETGLYKVDVYDGNPYGSGNLLISGTINRDKPFETNLNLPTYVDELFVVKTSQTGSSELAIKDLSSDNFNLVFESSLAKPNGKGGNEIASGPDCTTGCGTTFVNKNNLTVSGGTVCVTGNLTGNTKIKKNATLRVCGNLGSGSINVEKNGTLIITETATFNGQNLNVKKDGLLINYSDNFTYTSSFSPSGEVENYGIMNVSGNFNVNSNGELTNDGEIIVGQSFNNNDEVTNNFKITVGGNFSNNGNSDFTNNCHLVVTGNFQQNGDFFNHGFASSASAMHFNGGSDTELHNGAMFEANSLQFNGDVEGFGGTSTISIATTTNINGGADLSGTVELCDADGIENNNGNINAPATLSCNNVIPSSPCNPNGFGAPTVLDADNDGVADELDEYPNDPNKAFNNYTPSAQTFGTIAFEDLWPKKGDYDFNDLVTGYRFNRITNASNEVVEVEADFVVKAAGADLANGFGFEMPILSSAVSSVTGNEIDDVNFTSFNGNGTEAGNTNAVIIVTDNIKSLYTPATGFNYLNTEVGSPKVSVDTLHLIIALSANLTLNDLASPPFNPFMVINQNRGKEIHLLDNSPTELVNNLYFGTEDDASNPNQNSYYKTTTNLPWALVLPTDWEHVVETQEIGLAYPNFSTWATSGGLLNTNWYLPSVLGNVDLNYIWEEQAQ